MAISTAIDQNAVSRVVGIQTSFSNQLGNSAQILPQRLALVGQGATASTYLTTKRTVTSAQQVAETYGFGSPLHLAAKQIFPANGDGIGIIPCTVYPLTDAGTGVAAVGDITPSGAVTTQGSIIVRIAGESSNAAVIAVGDTVAQIVTKLTTAINANLDMPVTAVDNTTDVQLTAKWAGVSGNDIVVEVFQSVVTGAAFAITQPTGGLVNPDVQSALDQIGNVWETMLLNCLDIADTTALDAYNNFNIGRWLPQVNKPLIAFTGNVIADVTAATAVSDARPTDLTNAQLVAPGSINLPCVVAARQVARIISLANGNPPHDYGSQRVDGIVPGTDAEQWTYVQREQAVLAGSSTVQLQDGVIEISDVVTFYHPAGEPLPAYRFVVDIVKLQNVIFNIALEFNSSRWDGAPLIPDDQATVNPAAKKPSMAVAAAARIVNNLALEAILSDPDTIIAGITAQINATNPKRLDLCIPIKISGNTNIISIDVPWSFFFGPVTIAA